MSATSVRSTSSNACNTPVSMSQKDCCMQRTSWHNTTAETCMVLVMHVVLQRDGVFQKRSDVNICCRSSRIVTVSSAAQYFGDIHFDDPNLSRGYERWRAYGQSKLANTFFSMELSARLPISASITSNALHPGVVNTELARCFQKL